MTTTAFLIAAAIVLLAGFILITRLRLNTKDTPAKRRWVAIDQRRSRDRWAGV